MAHGVLFLHTHPKISLVSIRFLKPNSHLQVLLIVTKPNWQQKDFHQRPSIDYCDIFSPVIKSMTIRWVLSITVINNWQLFHLDVNNDFLQGWLHKKKSLCVNLGVLLKKIISIMIVLFKRPSKGPLWFKTRTAGLVL